MKKLVLRNLSVDVDRLIESRCENGKVTPEMAVVAILEEAALDFMVQHDIAIMESEDHHEETTLRPATTAERAGDHHCSGNFRHLIVCCHGPIRIA